MLRRFLTVIMCPLAAAYTAKSADEVAASHGSGRIVRLGYPAIASIEGAEG